MQIDDDDGLFYFGFCFAISSAPAALTALAWWFFYEVTR